MSFQTRLNKLTSQVEAVTKAIDEAISYSYQYNLKIVGFPQKNEKEMTEETTSLCLKILKKIGVDVTDTLTLLIESQQESKMRRMVRETVLAARANSNRLTSNDFDLPSDSQINRISESPTAEAPRSFVVSKFCWAKSTAVFLRKSDNSRICRIASDKDLEDLRGNESTNDESHSCLSFFSLYHYHIN